MTAPFSEAVGSSRQIESIHAMRGIAAFAVMWFHFTNGGDLLQDGWLKTTGKYGYLGVDVFFVISGFVIPYVLERGQYRPRLHFGAFLTKRLVRLEPPYLVALAITLILAVLSPMFPGFRGGHFQINWQAIALHVGYLTPWFGYPWLNPVFWSLAIELQFYLLMAVAFPAFASLRVRWIMLLAFALSALLVPHKLLVFHYASLFAFGILAWWRYSGAISMPAYLAAVFVTLALSISTLSGLEAAMAAICALTITFVPVRRTALLSFLGAISYSLYLIHVPIGGRIINLASRYADTLALQVISLAVATAFAIFVATLLMHFVERPSKRWSSAISFKPAGKPVSTGAVPARDS